MGRGIGKTQQRILDELDASEHGNLSVMALSQQLGVSGRQVRRAVHALAGRGLVVLATEPGGWAGVGRYGPLVRRDDGYWGENDEREPYGPGVPTAQVRRKLYEDFNDDGNLVWRYLNVEYVRAGMPTGVSLFVWTPQAHAERERRFAAFRAALSGD